MKENKPIDLTAPIIPYIGMGRIKLYSTCEELKDIISAPYVTAELFDNGIRHDIGNHMML